MPESGLYGGAGFAQGFADTFVQGMRDKRAAAAQAAQDQARTELQYELQRRKQEAGMIPGFKIVEHAVSLGIDPKQLGAINPLQEYPISTANTFLTQLSGLKKADESEAGKDKRAAQKPVAQMKDFDPTKAQADILATSAVLAGAKKGTPLRNLYKTEADVKSAIASIQEMGRARLKGANREADFDVGTPFTMTEEPGWFSRATYEPGNLFITRQGKVIQAPPLKPGKKPPPLPIEDGMDEFLTAP